MLHRQSRCDTSCIFSNSPSFSPTSCINADWATTQQTEAWIWEKQLFGGWVGGEDPYAYTEYPGDEAREHRLRVCHDDGRPSRRNYETVEAICLRCPKAGNEGFYRIDNTRIVRIVDGRDGWEEALPLVDADDRWLEGKRSLVRKAGPFTPVPKYEFAGYTRIFVHRDANGNTNIEEDKMPLPMGAGGDTDEDTDEEGSAALADRCV